MIVIIDYGVGNLFSLKSSFNAIGADVVVSSNSQDIISADKIVLPGVGAFSDAYRLLCQAGLDKTIINEANNGKPLLGVCLGMQLLFDKSYEDGQTPGLSLIHGDVVPISEYVDETYKIPQIGWNKLKFHNNSCKITKYINEGDFVYFVHSYFANNCDDNLDASVDYGCQISAIVSHNNIYGCQFHPEKSGKVGLNILKAFCEV